MNYSEFLATKQRRVAEIGLSIEPGDIHPMLHGWQNEIVRWAVRRGRAAVWADTGLGKTVMQLEWARLSGSRVLIVAPLAVCAQTVRESAKLGIEAHYVRSDAAAIGAGMWVTNYEMVEHFNPDALDAVVLDEASILKQSDGKTRTRLISHFANVKHRMTCTATPAPNDIEELTNQAEFLGIIPRTEMLAAYFVHDQDGWRLKGHARAPMMKWMAGWAVALRRPSDLGYPDDDYILPKLHIEPHLLPVDVVPEGQLFATDLGGVGGRASVRKSTLDARVTQAAELVVAEPDECWLLWCGLNDEADALARAIPGSVNVHGSWSPEDKANAFLDFADGKVSALITKPSIAAFGLNWQHCARMAFVGLSDSYEAYYQAIRRCWRYGQHREVYAHVVLSELEGQIAVNISRKESQASRITDALVRAMRTARLQEAA